MRTKKIVHRESLIPVAKFFRLYACGCKKAWISLQAFESALIKVPSSVPEMLQSNAAFSRRGLEPKPSLQVIDDKGTAPTRRRSPAASIPPPVNSRAKTSVEFTA